MATLQGQEIKDTYQALLKTDGNTNIDSTLQTITDGQGNATALSLSTDNIYVSGGIDNNISSSAGNASISNFYVNNGGTSGSQYFLYNSANRSIYLDAWTDNYDFHITTSQADKFLPGQQITFIHTYLGPLTGVVESSYFYNGEGSPLTIIKLTTDPSNGVNDNYGSAFLPPNVYFTNQTYSITSGFGNDSGFYNHTEGYYNTAIMPYAHTEGAYTTAIKRYTHTEGFYTVAIGEGSHAEGNSTTSLGAYSHTEGRFSSTVGNWSHAEGNATFTSGEFGHAEGAGTVVVGGASHAEGDRTTAIGNQSHTEGSITTAKGNYSHAEGYQTIAIGTYSHAEGVLTTTIGDYNHSEGAFTTSIGLYSHAEGLYTITSGSSIPQHAEGRYNIPDTVSLLIVGNGTAIGSRKNAFAITTFLTGSITSSTAVLQQVSESVGYANDAAAATAGIPLGGIYRSGSSLMIRMS